MVQLWVQVSWMIIEGVDEYTSWYTKTQPGMCSIATAKVWLQP